MFLFTLNTFCDLWGINKSFSTSISLWGNVSLFSEQLHWFNILLVLWLKMIICFDFLVIDTNYASFVGLQSKIVAVVKHFIKEWSRSTTGIGLLLGIQTEKTWKHADAFLHKGFLLRFFRVNKPGKSKIINMNVGPYKNTYYVDVERPV